MEIGDCFILKFKITQEIYDSFKQTFEDYNPLHTNEQYAHAKGFKGRVMYGNILNGFISNFIGEHLPIKDVLIHSQSIDFRKPVYLNDSLNFDAIIDNYSESTNVYEFKFNFSKDSKKVASGRIQVGLMSL